MASKSGLKRHANLVKSLEASIDNAEALGLDEMAETLKEEKAEAEAL